MFVRRLRVDVDVQREGGGSSPSHPSRSLATIFCSASTCRGLRGPRTQVLSGGHMYRGTSLIRNRVQGSELKVEG